MSDLVNYTYDVEEKEVEVVQAVSAMKQNILQEPLFVVEDVTAADKNSNGEMKKRQTPCTSVQERQDFSVDLETSTVLEADFAVCAISVNDYLKEVNFMVPADVEPAPELLPGPTLLGLVDGIQSNVLEAGIAVASKIGRAARRGKRIGATFVIGDSQRVLEGCHQLIPNPFKGHEGDVRYLTNPANHDTLIELAKLDGAFIIRGDGFIQSAAVFLMPGKSELRIPAGLGARHMAAAAMTARTLTTAIVVSATDGNIRIFSNGKLVMHLDPCVHHGPIAIEN